MSFGENVRDLVAANSFGVISCAPTWSREPLGNVARIINGFAFQSRFFRDKGGTPLIRIRNVVGRNTETFYDGPIPPGYWVEAGDLLVGMDGDFNCAHWSGDKALLNQRVCKIEVDDSRLCPRFLGYLLPGYLRLINAATSSITVKHLSSRTLQLLPIPLPSRETQDRIVARIDELFAEIEEGKQALADGRAGADTYRKALLKAAITGELTADWRSRNDTAPSGDDLRQEIVDMRRRKGHVFSKVDVGDVPFDVPPSWCWSSLGELFAIAVGATPNRGDKSLWNGTIPWVSSGEVAFSRIQDTRERISQDWVAPGRIHPIGTVMLGMIGEGRTRGQAAILDTPAAHNQNCASIRVSETPVPPEYVYWWLEYQYEKTRTESAGGNQPALNKARVGAISLPLPSRRELVKIVARLTRLLEEAEDARTLADDVSLLPSDLKQSILVAAFRGDFAA